MSPIVQVRRQFCPDDKEREKDERMLRARHLQGTAERRVLRARHLQVTAERERALSRSPTVVQPREIEISMPFVHIPRGGGPGGRGSVKNSEANFFQKRFRPKPV